MTAGNIKACTEIWEQGSCWMSLCKCIVSYCLIVSLLVSFCIIVLFRLIVSLHCIILPHCIIALSHFVSSCCFDSLYHCTVNIGDIPCQTMEYTGKLAWYLALKHIFSGMCTWPETDVLYLRLPAIRPFAHQKLSEVAWSDTCSGLATHLWSQVLNSLWFPTQQLPGGKPSRRRWFSFFFFFFRQTAQQNEATGWGNRKPMSHPGSSLSVWGAFCSVCCRTWDRSSTFLFTKLTKGREKQYSPSVW